MRALRQQEQPARDQDQITPRDLLPHHLEQRRRQADQPRQRKQQRDARQHRQRQTQPPRRVPPLRRQLARQDRDEHDIVDAEDDLEHRQGGQRNPPFRGGGPAERVDQ